MALDRNHFWLAGIGLRFVQQAYANAQRNLEGRGCEEVLASLLNAELVGTYRTVDSRLSL